MKKTLIALGDSITAGWPYEMKVSWVEKVRQKLPFLNVINKGVSGDTFGDMLKRLEEDVLVYKPDYCIIMGGTNEAYLHIPQPVLKKNFLKIIEKLIAVDCNIIVGLPLPVEDFAMELYLQDIRQWLEDFCQKNNFKILDFYNEMKDEKNNIKAELFLDGCHPNKTGYSLMGDYALRQLKYLE